MKSAKESMPSHVINSPASPAELQRAILEYVHSQDVPCDIPDLVSRFATAVLPTVSIRQAIAELTGNSELELTPDWKVKPGKHAELRLNEGIAS